MPVFGQLFREVFPVDDGSVLLPILLQIILIALNAVFASAEIAVISISDAKLGKLAALGDKRAKRLVKLTEQPARFLATIQVAITLSGFLGSAFAAENFSDRIVDWLLGHGVTIPESTLNSLSVILITLILSYVTLVFGELVPKRVAMKKTERIALGVSAPVSFLSKVFAPVVSLLTLSTNVLLKILGIDPNADEEEVTEEEIRMLVDAGGEKGVIDKEESEFIQNVFEFDDLTAEEVATHRTEISILWFDDDPETWEETIHKSRYTRYLVCGSSEDDVIGVLDARDYFRISGKTHENIMAEAVKPAYYVPKTVKADVLFHRMRRDNQRLAVVLDEYGGLCGIITLIDLVERLVGDLGGEEDSPKDILRISADTWQIYGSAPTRDVYEELGLAQPEEYPSSTFGGLILSELGAIPEDGSRPEVIFDGFKITVNQVSDHRIGLTTVHRLSQDISQDNE